MTLRKSFIARRSYRYIASYNTWGGGVDNEFLHRGVGIGVKKTHDQFEEIVTRAEWCSSIHVDCFYTPESRKTPCNNVYNSALHVYNISCCETSKLEEYSVV